MEAVKVGPYTLVEELRKGWCAWLLVSDDDDNRQVVQVVTPKLTRLEKRDILQLQADVKKLNNPNLICSTESFESDFSSSFRYPASVSADLASPLRERPDANEKIFLPIIEQTLSLLSVLHGAGLTMGLFLPHSVLWRDGQIKLYTFLWDVLVRENTNDIRGRFADFFAPELRGSELSPTPQSDLWSLADYAGKIFPEIVRTEWYIACHTADPKGRPASTSDAIALLKGNTPIKVVEDEEETGQDAGGETPQEPKGKKDVEVKKKEEDADEKARKEEEAREKARKEEEEREGKRKEEEEKEKKRKKDREKIDPDQRDALVYERMKALKKEKFLAFVVAVVMISGLVGLISLSTQILRDYVK